MSFRMRNAKAVRGLLGTGVAVFLAIAPVFAHHVPAAKFDPDQPITLRGSVSKIDWLNPHVHIFMEVRDGMGMPPRAGPSNWIVRSISEETAGARKQSSLAMRSR